VQIVESDPTETWAVQDFCSANWLSSARQTACFAAFIFVLMAAETCEPGDPMAADAAHAPDNQPKAKIFISYSRKDMGFADRLQTELEARGFIVLIDRSEIYAFEDWWTRIQALIVKADTIIFVLSPDAVASDICAKEVAFAASLNKRFAPIACRRVDDSSVPTALRRLHFIFFDDESYFNEGMAHLVEALETDIEWVRKHTEFGEVAHRWLGAGRPGPGGLLLRSPILEEAEQWLAGRPRGAPEPTETTRAFIAESRKAAVRRRNMLTGALSLALVVALGLLSLAYGAFYRAEQQRNEALIAQSEFLARDARIATASGRPTLGALLALAALPEDLSRPDRPFVPDAEYALRDAYANFRDQMLLGLPSGYASYYAEFSPNGRYILAISKTVEIWDAATGAHVQTLEGKEMPSVGAAFFSPDSRMVVTAGLEDKVVRVWDVKTGAELLELPDDSPAWAVSISRDSRKIVAVSKDGVARIWDIGSGALLQRITTYTQTSIADFSPDGRRLLVAAQNDAILFDVDSGTRIARLVGHQGQIHSAHYSPDGALIATASADKTARVWDAESGAEKFTLRGHDNQVESVEFSPDGTKLVTGSLDGTAALWDVKSGTLIVIMRGHQDRVNSALFSPDGQFIATASGDGTARLWSTDNGGLIGVLRQIDVYSNSMGSAKFSPDSRSIVTASSEPYVHVWNVKSRELQAIIAPPEYCFGLVLSPEGRNVLCDDIGNMYLMDLSTNKMLWSTKYDGNGTFAYSHNGNLIAAGCNDGRVQIWDAKTAKLLATLRAHNKRVNVLKFSLHDDLLITGADQAIVWEVATWEQLRILADHRDGVNHIAVSPDSKYVATSEPAALKVRLWNVATGQIVAQRVGGGDVAFSPVGNRLAVASAFRATILDIADGHEITTQSYVPQEINELTFSPDGRVLLTTGPNHHRVQLWDASTGAEILAYTGHPDFVVSASFAPQPLRVVSQTNKSLWLWGLPPECQALIDTVRSELRRDLTDEERKRYFLENERPRNESWLVATARRIFSFALPKSKAACA